MLFDLLLTMDKFTAAGAATHCWLVVPCAAGFTCLCRTLYRCDARGERVRHDRPDGPLQRQSAVADAVLPRRTVRFVVRSMGASRSCCCSVALPARASRIRNRTLEEIDDPLYGSADRGGAEEVAAVTAAAKLLASCCEARGMRRRAPRA